MQKRILGLNLSITSIGWALITENTDTTKSIAAMGSRIVPLSTSDKDEFSKGTAISKNRERTIKRTQRKVYNRYQQRRYALTKVLTANNMMPDEVLMNLPALELFALRNRAAKEKLSLKELGRVLYHLNQRRGYKSSRSDAHMDKKDTDYVAAVKGRHKTIKEAGLTIGQYFYTQLKAPVYCRIKEQIFPREAYIEEFDTICNEQKKHHSGLSNELIDQLRNETIYFHRKLKSQKGLVSICEFEGKLIKDKEGEEKFAGPKVAPRSSPVFQLCTIWENVNNITLRVKNSEGSKDKWRDHLLPLEQKAAIANYLSKNEKLNYTDLLKIINLKKEDVYATKKTKEGLTGNKTYTEISSILTDKKLLRLTLTEKEVPENAVLVDKKTGEILEEIKAAVIENTIEKEPFYQLWHTIYSIKDKEECRAALIKRFELNEQEAEKLAAIDFNKQGFSNKSNKAIRKILPYLMKGYTYAHACSLAGYNQSTSFTSKEKERLTVSSTLPHLQKNSLRQPVIEKILNQMINLANALVIKYGQPDEIRVELARKLKQTKDERNEAERQNVNNTKLNELIAKRLIELGIPNTKKNCNKYKYLFPVKDNKWDEAYTINQCIYCGKAFTITEALSGDNFDIDHIIPQSMLYDDSQTNKVLVHRSCNKDKTNTTAYDYMASRGEAVLTEYLERVDDWHHKNILSYSKAERLKVSYTAYTERKRLDKETEADKRLWENFIDRQIRETAYIARKARQLLQGICRNVHSTEGGVTAKLRNAWGWDEVLLNLQIDKYRGIGQTTTKEWGRNYRADAPQKEAINDWCKHDDNRHHAIDALVTACTQQEFIQRMNTLHASEVKSEMMAELKKERENNAAKQTLLDQYLASKRPFTTKEVEEAAAKILTSFKAGKKVATISKYKAKGKNESTGVITPRGSLSEESVYGKIQTIEPNKPLKFLFENPHLIFKPYLKQLVENRILEYNGDSKKAFAATKYTPIYINKENTIPLSHGTCYKNEIVLKYPLASIKEKDVPYIVDKRVREIIKKRIETLGEKEAFKGLDKNPVLYNENPANQIRSVRLFANLEAVEPIKFNTAGKAIGFVKPGSNHHLALYKDEKGKLHEHICTFWHAVERKKYNLPAIIENTDTLWNKILQHKSDFKENFLEKLPEDGWKLVLSMQQNEAFIIGLSKEDAEKAIKDNDRKTISKYMYIVWAIAEGDYWFRHHLETKNSELKKNQGAKEAKRYYRFSTTSFIKENPTKIKIDILGQIAAI